MRPRRFANSRHANPPHPLSYPNLSSLRTLLALVLLLGTSATTLSASQTEPGPNLARPNLVIILADDLGFSDLGCYGGEIRTPNLDQLAHDGLRFSQFYNTGRCWPTRASLLTGFYAQAVRRDAVPGIPSGGRGVRPEWAPLIAAPLKQSGYRCYHSGKWHIDGMPLQNGFDASYYLQDQGRFFSPRVHYRNDQPLPAVERNTGFYGTRAIGDHAVNDLRDHAAQHSGQPFFLYLAFTAPHFPLHAPQQVIDQYRDTYRAGWDTIRQQRWQRIQDEGFISGRLSDVQPDVGPPYDFPTAIEQLGPGEINHPAPWDTLTPAQQQFQATKMAIHAAMIDILDQQVGRVIEQLKAMDAWDNTLILFLSDNGASAEIMVRSDGHDPAAPLGSASSYLCLGPGWSTVSNTPFRYHKTWNHEGGIATPAIAHWPNQIDRTGQWVHQPLHVIDVFPTLAQLARLPTPAASSASRPGTSFLPLLISEAQPTEAQPTEPRTLYWHHEGNRAIRVGHWKLVAVSDGPWELYDLSADRSETHNLADQHPKRVRELAARWQTLHQQQIETATTAKP